MLLAELTNHASLRLQQRGKKKEAVSLVYRYGDLDRHAGTRRTATRLSRRACQMLIQRGTPPALVDRAQRIEIVTSEYDGMIITILNAPHI